MNKVIFLGRLGKDPEVRYGSNDHVVATFSLAVDRKYKRDNEPTVDFFNLVAFGKTAEFCEKYLRQGTKVLVTGRVQNDNYTNKDGQKVYSTQVYVDEIEFAESKASGTQAKPQNNDFINVDDSDLEELPFN